MAGMDSKVFAAKFTLLVLIAATGPGQGTMTDEHSSASDIGKCSGDQQLCGADSFDENFDETNLMQLRMSVSSQNAKKHKSEDAGGGDSGKPPSEFAPRPECLAAISGSESCMSNKDVAGCVKAGWEPGTAACMALEMLHLKGISPKGCDSEKIKMACGIEPASSLLEDKDTEEEEDKKEQNDAGRARRRRRFWQALYSWR